MIFTGSAQLAYIADTSNTTNGKSSDSTAFAHATDVQLVSFHMENYRDGAFTHKDGVGVDLKCRGWKHSCLHC